VLEEKPGGAVDLLETSLLVKQAAAQVAKPASGGLQGKVRWARWRGARRRRGPRLLQGADAASPAPPPQAAADAARAVAALRLFGWAAAAAASASA
jgi:hypothetical protein